MSNSDVITIDNFVSDSDCDYLIKTYDEKVFKSLVVGGQKHESRTSSSFYIPSSDPVIKKIREKTADFLKIPQNNIETIQFLKYVKGEKYSYHYDLLPGDNVPNQRVHTIIVYLNTLAPEDGGATSFFHYNLKVTPKKGMGVWFKNLNDDGTSNTKSLHAGEEILADGVIKYALNIWTRQTKF
jgi:prolyl 4-hydroxylase